MHVIPFITNKLHLSSSKELIVQNLLWSVLGKIINLLSGLFVGIIIARFLGPANYGLMNYVISYVFLFSTFATFGLDTIEIREEARKQVRFETIIGTAFCLKIIFGILMIAATILTSWVMDADRYVTFLVAIYSITIVLNASFVIRNYFTAIVQNESIVKAEIVATLVGIVIKVILLLLGASLTWFLSAYMFDVALITIGYTIAYSTKIGYMGKWNVDWKYAMFLLKEAFPLLLTNTAVIIYQRIDQVMIGQMIDSKAVGYFSVASRFVEVLIYVPMILAQTITPVLVRIREHSQEDYIKKGQQFMNISLWLTILLSAIMSACAYLLIKYTFGSVYIPAVAVLQLMSFKAASVALSNTAGAMLVIEGLQRYAIIRDSIGCVVCITLNYLLLPRYGIIAAAFVAIASNVAAGYIADALIPAYRHLFIRQTKALLTGWKDMINIKQLLASQ